MTFILSMGLSAINLLALAVSLWSWNLRRYLSTSPDAPIALKKLELEGVTVAASSSSSLSSDEVAHNSALSDSEDDEVASQPEDSRFENELTLEEAFPDSTKEERTRVLAARNGDPKRAAECLASYMDWRRRYETTPAHVSTSIRATGDSDIDDWNIAVATALYAHDKPIIALPRIVRIPSEAVSRQGYRIMQILPALIDDKLADTKVYSLAIALYCDRKLKRNSLEVLCVIVDVRSGFGWPNMPLTGFLSFAKNTVALMLSNFPERLGCALVYPVPPMFGWVWRTISYFIDPDTKAKFSLLSGENTKLSPPPYGQLVRFLQPEVIELLERERRSSFTEEEGP